MEYGSSGYCLKIHLAGSLTLVVEPKSEFNDGLIVGRICVDLTQLFLGIYHHTRT